MIDMTGPEHQGSTIQRLDRLEGKVDELATDLRSLTTHVSTLQSAEDRRFTDRLLPDRVRALEDQMLETRIYLKQAKWAVVVAIGAVITGIINVALSLFTLSGHA